MSSNFEKYYQSAYSWAFLACIAVLPMSGTIALRNILLAFMLSLFVYGNIFIPDIRRGTLEALKKIPRPLILWIVYLCVFPLWAPLPEIAWENLRGQWGESIVAWVIGLGAFVLLKSRGPGLWKLAMASAFPLYVHLILALLASIGVFSENFYRLEESQSLEGLYAEVRMWLDGGFTGFHPHKPLAEGFRGIEAMHGNLGYTSSVAIALLTAILFGARRNINLRAAMPCIVAIGLCFLSLLMARSRGAMAFGVLILCTAIIWNYLAAVPSHAFANSSPMDRGLTVGAFILCMVFGIGFIGLKTDARWGGMADRISAGFLIEDPLRTLCAGLSDEQEAVIRNRLAEHTADYVNEVVSHVRNGDGGRVVLMREGVQLAWENPLGLDGSRQSYERLMQKKCGATPVLNYAHSHNSWFDLSMAIGWTGVALFASIFIGLFAAARKGFSDAKGSSVALALGLLSMFWFLRGFFDSLYREHYLEMQAVILMYLYLLLSRRGPGKFV